MPNTPTDPLSTNAADAAVVKAFVMAQGQQPHSSRSKPLCKDCAHFANGYCNHPSAPISLINGEPVLTAVAMRKSGTPEGGPAPCGPSGTLFAADGRCTTCNGAGKVRPAYSREFTACPDCLTRPISMASATTDASVNPAGSSDSQIDRAVLTLS